MLERFTDRSRKVMQLAIQEAQRFNHEFVDTHHILLGLIKEGSGVAANCLKNLDIDLRKVRLEVEKITGTVGGDHVVLGKLPHTPAAKKVIELAVEAARGLKHNYVGTEHLLLGLLAEREGVACQVLTNLGVTTEALRAEIINMLGEPKPDAVFQARWITVTPDDPHTSQDRQSVRGEQSLVTVLERVKTMQHLMSILADSVRKLIADQEKKDK